MTTGKYRIVAYIRCKNEEWVLEKWLARTAVFVDAIVALDDASTDKTHEILRSHPKVIRLFRNPDQGGRWCQVRDLNRLLTEAKRLNPEWLYFSDADELADARLVGRLDELLADATVGQYLFREITLWRSTSHYRVDRPDKYMRIHPENIALIRNVPSLRWECVRPYHKQLYGAIRSWLRGKRYNFLRYPGTHDRRFVGVVGRVVELHDLVKLHYHFANWEYAWRKQIRFTLNQVLAHTGYSMRDIDYLVDFCCHRMDETGLKLAPVDPSWGVL